MSVEFQVYLWVKPEEQVALIERCLQRFGPEREHPEYHISASERVGESLILDVVAVQKTDPVYDAASRVVQLICPESPGLVRMALQVTTETLDELQRLGSSAPEYESLDLPDVETRLWLGKRSHEAWREGNLPRVHPDFSPNTALKCLRCYRKLAGERVVVWLTPTARFGGEWTEVGMHVACPS